jgi:CubicO group peptidase (beta-lactamase class C family)
MIDSFPEVAGRITDPRKEQITIRQMLQMRAGYPWEESDQALWDGLLSGRYVPLIEGFPLVSDPGTKFHYSNLTSNWLGIIVDRACGMNLRSYAQEHLFSKMGVEAGEWGTDWEGHNNGCGDLHLTARDMAKFGLLYLNGGEYQGQQIIPSDWVRDSLETYSEHAWDNIGPLRDIGYGYHWWSARAGEHRVNFAWGHGGQLIVLVDELDLVVVVTADPFWLEHSSESWKHEKAHFELVADFIKSLPSE